MLITEVILENFMSYEYARIPFKPGVNVVCGPNGAGKSSILLGISLALGQSHTERSRKLSNLIRWGKDQARVTLVLDNSVRNGKRPLRKINKDQIFLTRGLRRDGKYWFELENRAATKVAVERLLKKFSVDPNNLLIVMHQNMTELFTVMSPQEKLTTVEEAVGLGSYRKNVFQAQKKLSRILSQEESVTKLLESAEQTLNYWREQYDRYQQKKQLQLKRRFLEREMAWAEASKREHVKIDLETQLRIEEEELKRLETEIVKVQDQLGMLHSQLDKAKSEWEKLLDQRILSEREKARHESYLKHQTEGLEELRRRVEANCQKVRGFNTIVDHFISATHSAQASVASTSIFAELQRAYKNLEDTWTQQLQYKSEHLKTLVEGYNEQLEKTDKDLSETRMRTEHTSNEIQHLTDQLIDSKIHAAISHFKKETIEKHVRKLHRDLKTKTQEYEEAARKAEQTGSRIASTRSVSDILDEIRLTDGFLTALTDVSEDIEKMYESYSKLYLDLKEKARVVAENRQLAMEEVEARMQSWRNVMQNLLNSVSIEYQRILSESYAQGEIHLVFEKDIEAAGLEVHVGFKGANPVPLDAYTQSGGERSMATISFLLALQQHVQSPFRAVDEYDVHMDPRNRETITNLLIESVKDLNSQYLIITPSQITFAKKEIHLIAVQNVEGSSKVTEAR